MKSMWKITGKILYAAAFLIALPAVLILWAQYTRPYILFPSIASEIAGRIMMVFGGILMLWAMWALLRFGKGLPMNAYPPPVYVSKGPYFFIRHPIYVGFIVLMTGYFVLSGSASGIWLVIPLTTLGIISLTMGYENPDLRRRFPDQHARPVLSLPENSTDSPGKIERVIQVLLNLSCVLLINFLIITVRKFFSSIPTGEQDLIKNIPFDIANFAGFVFIALVPFFINTRALLRQWQISGLFSLGVLFFTLVLIPEITAGIYPAGNQALFTIPVFLIFISISVLVKQSGRAAVVFAVFGLFLFILHIAASKSEISYLAGSIIIFLISSYYMSGWIFLRNIAEKIANSWKEWVFGKVRVLNRGFYIGAGTFSGLLLAGFLTGTHYVYALLVFSVIVTITSALWAQLIEGSAKLKRPFGFYGGLVGIIFGTLVIWALGFHGWVIIGVASVVMPWMQAIGRLGCLVNGCCHGSRVSDPLIGIRYFHPRSRVCNISGLKGELLHPTQLYSIIWLFFTGIIMLNLWYRGLSFSFIFGIYLILTGLGRFVEESYRGEVQTPGIGGLRLYQWTAAISVLIGIIMTFIYTKPVALMPGLGGETFLTAALAGLFLFFAMGVDFPYSNARFSRLV
jgi:protein-S-isoprenylcysteine O-methyltransferase Ste14